MTNKDGEITNTTPQIKAVKIVSAYTGAGVEVNKGVATNGSMPRVDIIYKNGKYYTVPLYVADFVKNKLPTISKPHNIDFPIQPKVDNDRFYNEYFKFSLFKDEPIFIEHKDGTKYFGYFVKYALHKNQGQICFENSDRKRFGTSVEKKTGKVRIKKEKQIDINSIESLTKYQVDPLGYISEVDQEKRQGIIRDNKKTQKINF